MMLRSHTYKGFQSDSFMYLFHLIEASMVNLRSADALQVTNADKHRYVHDLWAQITPKFNRIGFR